MWQGFSFFKQFSFPGDIGSHATPETPGSIHEGGELGYSISHAFGTAFDNPDPITLVVVGDGESETAPLAASRHGNKFLNPITDGAVLPVLHLNGYKINNPTLLARISHEEPEALFVGYGYTPYFVEGSDHDVNVIVADKQLHLQYLDVDAAAAPCTKGAVIWDWASSNQGGRAGVQEALLNEQIACMNYAYEFGVDPQDVTDWKWPF
jgi:phosphoketolase